MATTPSIKGSIFCRAMEDLQKLVSDGAVSRQDLAKRLEPEDLTLLDEAGWPSGWYDVQCYGRILEALKDHAGNGNDEYLIERGEKTARALLDQGLYQQLEYLSRVQVVSAQEPEARFKAFGRDLSLLCSLHRVILNFGEQRPEVDPDHADRYAIRLTGVEAMPDALCWTTLGFINGLARQHGEDDLWAAEQPSEDVLLFRMTRPV